MIKNKDQSNEYTVGTVTVLELTMKTLRWWIFWGSDNNSKGPAVKKCTIN